VVYDATHKRSGEKWAIKKMSKVELRKLGLIDEAPQREIEILKTLDHPNVIKLKESIETEHDVYLVLEKVCSKDKDLFNRVKYNAPLNEASALRIFRQLVSAVRYCHGMNVTHRDLKPENILMCKDGEDDIKITDFGLSKRTGASGIMGSLVGTGLYAAPEVFSLGPYNNSVDLFALGVILYMMLSGSLPHKPDDR